MEQKRQLVMDDERFFFLKGNWRAVGMVFVITISFLLYQNLLTPDYRTNRTLTIAKLFKDGLKHVYKQRFEFALEKADEIDNIQSVLGSTYIRFLVSKARGRDEEMVRYAKEIFNQAPSRKDGEICKRDI
jgi:hypothetical protein